MPYTTSVAGTTITASWANANVRDQVVTPFSSTSALASAITAPVVGMTSYILSNDANEGILTRSSAGQWRLPWNMPWGKVALSVSTANVGPITTIANLGPSATWTPVANRLYRTTGFVTLNPSVSTGQTNQVQIQDGTSTNVQIAYTRSSVGEPMSVSVSLTESGLSAVSTTRKLAGAVVSGGGSFTTNAATATPAYIVVEDVGPNGAPA